MASNRSRGIDSLGGHLERINSKISRNEKRRSELVTNAVTNEALAPGSVTGEAIPDGTVTGVKLARGAVATENLGLINTIYSDGDVTFVLPPEGSLNVEGGVYVLPAAGTSAAIRLNSVGELVPWGGSPAIATVDLNDYTVPGQYHQGSNAQAAAGLNHPIGHAGSLTVSAVEGGAFIYQIYHSYEDFNNFYFRGRYLGQWAPWAQAAKVGHTHVAADIGTIPASQISGLQDGRAVPWTPTLAGTGFVLGNGTRKAWYSVSNGRCFVEVLFNHGSTSVISGAVKVNFPITPSAIYDEVADSQYNLGVSRYLNSGISGHPGGVSFNPTSDATHVYFDRFTVSGAEIVTSGVSSAAPFTWGTGDDITASFSYFIA